MKTIRYLALHIPVMGALAAWLSLTSAQAASVSSYGLGKAERFEQTSDTSVAAADDAYAFKAFAVPTSAGSVLGALVTVPGGPIPVFLSGEDVLIGELTFSSSGDLENSYPAGQYSWTFMALTSPQPEQANLTLGSATYPNTPQIANYTAAQAIDASKDFTLNWNAFDGATSNDTIQLTVLDEDGNVVFQTGFPGQAGALAATARSVTIPANRLKSRSNQATLSFTRVASRNTTALAGATGVTTFARETLFTLKTGSSGGNGGSDTTPPRLVSFNPALLASNVPTNSPVIFTFSEPMAPVQDVFWNGQGVDESKFTYSWSGDGRTLTCTYAGGLPANSMIVWGLEPSGFTDVAGNELDDTEAGGMFTTGAGQSNPTDPCHDPDDDGRGIVTISKTYNYVQTGTAAPVLDSSDPDGALMFFAMLGSPDTNPVTQATLVLPNGTTKPMENFFGGNFSVMDQFATKEAMEAAYPAGTYKVQMQRASGAAVLSLNLAASTEPPVPHIANFDAVQQFDPVADFTLRWDSFTGAGKDDVISVNLHDMKGTTFNAPDPCIPRPLAVTDTSILVPKNTFPAGSPVEGMLMFMKFSAFDTNTVRDIVATAGMSKQTSFKMGTPSSTQVVLQNYAREANGAFRFQVKAPTGATVIVEASTDLVSWLPVKTGAATAGVLEVMDTDAAANQRRYYRARTLF